ncbi:MAG TPA: polysaccharide biosynthesis C-terminal domain-containing protein [Micromonosporaceae bacterium]
MTSQAEEQSPTVTVPPSATEPKIPGQGAYGFDRNRIARAGALNLVGAAVSVVATFGLTIVVTRNTTQQVAGAYFILTSVFLILQAAKLGADSGAVYMLAQHRALGQTNRIRAAMRVAYVPISVVSVAFTIAIWLMAPWLSRELLSTDSSAAVTSLRIFALCLPFSVVGLVAQSGARGLGTTVPYVAMERVVRPGLQLAGAAVVVVTLGAASWTGLAGSFSLPYILTGVISVPWLIALRKRAERRAGQAPLPTSRDDWTGFWKFSGPRAGTGLLTLGLQRLDVVIIGILRGTKDAAYYTAATRFLVVGQTISNALSVAVQHRFSALMARGERGDANKLYQMTTTWLILLTWPFYLSWAVLAHRLMALFGHAYQATFNVGIILALAMLVGTACGMVSMVLDMSGNTGVTLAQTALALTADIVIDLLLVPKYGPLGAAIGWATAIGLNNLLPLATLYRRYRLFPIGRGGLIAMGASVACFVVIPFATRLAFGDTVVTAVGAFAVGCIAYAVLVWRARTALELAGLRALRRRGTK